MLVSEFKPRSNDWNSMDFLKGLSRKDIELSDEFLNENKDSFLFATYTEFDAKNLSRHLDSLDINFTPEFMAFKKFWKRDEENHYTGFRYIYSIMFNEEEEKVANVIESRPYNFGNLKDFLHDEFTICLLIAYDEILTTKAYSSERKLYSSLGNAAFYDWMRKVTIDEAFHFHNIMEVIRLRHSHRILEIPRIVTSLVNLDLERNNYEGTFVMDHESYFFDFLKSGVSVIERYLKRYLK